MREKYFETVVNLIEEYHHGSREYSVEDLYDKIYLYRRKGLVDEEEGSALMDMMEELSY